MNTGNSTISVNKSRREWLYSFILVVLSSAFCIALVENGLSWHQKSIDESSVIDPGLLRYHPQLGWTLSPSWRGRHQHHDFDVQYTTNSAGFRGEFLSTPYRKTKPSYAVFGDSFSFGLGVNDDEVYVARQNQRHSSAEFLNFSIPGYSTDQQLLLMEAIGPRYNPDRTLLAIYLGNDLLDNVLPYPLQAEQAKPFFELDDERKLILKNVPTPRTPKPAMLRSMTLNSIIFGESLKDYENTSFAQDSRIWQRLIPRKAGADQVTVFQILDGRLVEQKKVMQALLNKINAYTSSHDRPLTIILLSGRSYILAPDSYSAYFQEYVRLFILDTAAELNIPVVDVANAMRHSESADASQWFHPNEGHLTPRGHQLVSDILTEELQIGVSK